MSPGATRSALSLEKRRVRAPEGSRAVSWSWVICAMGSLQSLRVDRGGGMVGILRRPSSKPVKRDQLMKELESGLRKGSRFCFVATEGRKPFEGGCRKFLGISEG